MERELLVHQAPARAIAAVLRERVGQKAGPIVAGVSCDCLLLLGNGGQARRARHLVHVELCRKRLRTPTFPKLGKRSHTRMVPGPCAMSRFFERGHRMRDRRLVQRVAGTLPRLAAGRSRGRTSVQRRPSGSHRNERRRRKHHAVKRPMCHPKEASQSLRGRHGFQRQHRGSHRCEGTGSHRRLAPAPSVAVLWLCPASPGAAGPVNHGRCIILIWVGRVETVDGSLAFAHHA